MTGVKLNRKSKIYVLWGAFFCGGGFCFVLFLLLLVSSFVFFPIAGVRQSFLARELPKSETFQAKPITAGYNLELLAPVQFATPGRT